MTYKSSHTMGTQEMIDAMVAELSDEYPMELNSRDMEALIIALAVAINEDVPPCTHEDCVDIGEDCHTERITSLFSSIAETLNIEGV